MVYWGIGFGEEDLFYYILLVYYIVYVKRIEIFGRMGESIILIILLIL